MSGALSKIVGNRLKLFEIACFAMGQKLWLQPFITQEMELEQFFLTASIYIYIYIYTYSYIYIYVVKCN